MARTYADTLEDIKDVMAFTGCSEDAAIGALLDTGSIDDAIAQIRDEERSKVLGEYNRAEELRALAAELAAELA